MIELDGLHKSLIQSAPERFPEESFRLLLEAGYTPRQALEALGCG